MPEIWWVTAQGYNSLTAGDGVEPLGGGPAEASTPYAPDETIGSITEALLVRHNDDNSKKHAGKNRKD
jgi:hypothetical protein